MNNKNGGAAFPSGEAYMQNGTLNKKGALHEGMTLRDYFAAKALKTKAWSVRPYDTRAEIAKDCYAMADAMLTEREKGNN